MAGVCSEWPVPHIWTDWKAAAAVTRQRSLAVGEVNTPRKQTVWEGSVEHQAERGKKPVVHQAKHQARAQGQ